MEPVKNKMNNNNNSELFAPQFAEDVKSVLVTGQFDPTLDLWVGERGAVAGSTWGPETQAMVLIGSPGSGPATDILGNPDDPIGTDDLWVRESDGMDADWC